MPNYHLKLINVFFSFMKGLDKVSATKLLNTHWTMRIWQEEDKSWGCLFTCKELPHLSIMENVREGMEQNISHPLFGGKAMVSI